MGCVQSTPTNTDNFTDIDSKNEENAAVDKKGRRKNDYQKDPTGLLKTFSSEEPSIPNCKNNACSPHF